MYLPKELTGSGISLPTNCRPDVDVLRSDYATYSHSTIWYIILPMTLKKWSFNQLSVAFAKEESAEAASETILPPRTISPHPNLVTENGLSMLQDEFARARLALDAANILEDVNEKRRQSAAPLRDTRYFAERNRTAHLMFAPRFNDVVAFGHTVTFKRNDGRTQTFYMVGEDEADPSQASISHSSPVAIALLGKSVGEFVQMGQRELEILSIS